MSTLSKLTRIFSGQQRRSALFLCVMMLVGTALETIGVGLAVPAVMLMVPQDPVTAPARGLPRALGNFTREQQILLGMGILVVAYSVKTVFLSIFAWVQSRFVQSLQATVSEKLFAGYLRQPYAFHLQRNSAELIQNTIGHSHTVASVAHQFLNAASELLVLVAVSVLLVVIQPIGTLAVAVSTGCVAWVLNLLTRRRVTAWGRSAQWHDRMRLQHLQQGFGGVKEVKLLGREADFVGRFKHDTDEFARTNVKHGTVQQLPRLWLELLAVLGLAVLALVLILQGRSVEMVLPTMGLFAAATFRIMPSATRLLGAVPVVRFSAPSVDTVFRELQLFDTTPDDSGANVSAFSDALTLTNVTYQYDGAAHRALTNVNVVIERGACVGFVGESGSGKSTLIDIILGLLTPESGTVAVDGVDIRGHIRSWQQQIGYVPQSIFLTDESLRKNVAFGLPDADIRDEAVASAIRAAQLEEFVKTLPAGLDTIVGERGVRLSGGQRQRIGIARALYHNPSVLVLDEATSALDAITEEGVMRSVAALEGDKTVLIVAHRWSTVAGCDRIYRLEHGTITETDVPARFTTPVQ